MHKPEAVTVRLDPPLKAFVERKAAEEDRSLSSAIRRIVADAARQSAQQGAAA